MNILDVLHITFYSLARTRHLVGADVCDPDLPSFTSLFFRIYFGKSINLPLIIHESNIRFMPTFLE